MADTDPQRNFNVSLIKAFIGLQLAAAIGFSLILITALASRNVKRNSTWYTFCLSWIVSCISYTFVFAIGQQASPSFGPCLFQASAIYSSPSLTSCTTLAFAIEMLIGVRTESKPLTPRHRYIINLLLLIVPWLIWLFILSGMLIYATSNMNQVQIGPNGTYCGFKSFTPSRISSLVVICGMLCLLIIEGYIGARLIKNRNLLKDRQLTGMAIRIIIFSVLGALALGVGIADVLSGRVGPEFDIIMASLPACGILIFGTQIDLINVWFFWRCRNANGDFDALKSPSIPEVPTPQFEKPSDLEKGYK